MTTDEEEEERFNRVLEAFKGNLAKGPDPEKETPAGRARKLAWRMEADRRRAVEATRFMRFYG